MAAPFDMVNVPSAEQNLRQIVNPLKQKTYCHDRLAIWSDKVLYPATGCR
jgi:hypothetical protein